MEKNLFFFSLILLALSSLILAHWGSANKPVASFYLLPTRGWEIILGSICAYAISLNFISNKFHLVNVLSLIGLTLILLSIYYFDNHTPVPSLYTLIPTVGTALIILFASKGTFVNFLLSSKLLVSVGLISYSTYLWHQPIFSFFKITIPQQAFIQNHHLLIMVGLSFLSLFLGWISWRFIERPFRISTDKVNLNNEIRGKKFLLSCFLIAIMFASISLFFVIQSGYSKRLNQDIIKIISQENDRSPLKDNCQIPDGEILHPLKNCSDFLINNKAEVVFIGDSHSNAISFKSQELLFEKGISSYSVSYNGCIGLRGFYTVTKPINHDCNKYNTDIIEYSKKIGANTLVITSRFPLYITGERFNNTVGGIEFGRPIYVDVHDNKNKQSVNNNKRKQRVLKKIEFEIKKLTSEFNVIMINPIPEMGWNIPREMAKCNLLKINECRYDYPIEVYFDRIKEVSEIFGKINNSHFTLIAPSDFICNIEKGSCMGVIDGNSLYYDDDHLSHNVGSILLAPHIMKAVKGFR